MINKHSYAGSDHHKGYYAQDLSSKAHSTILLKAARQQADKLHQQNIQMIKSSNMSKKEKAMALKKIKAAYCR